MICGGIEARRDALVGCRFRDESRCRPEMMARETASALGTADRDGFVLGEGRATYSGGAWSTHLRRGANVLAEPLLTPRIRTPSPPMLRRRMVEEFAV